MPDTNDTPVEPAVTPALKKAAKVKYDPDVLYSVTLARPVILFGVLHSPMHINHIAGRYIADLGDAVIDATAI